MIWTLIALFAAGMFLSAFFSGSETGFYRVNRVRLMLDALDGSPTAKWMLWLANHPSVFVATTLIGNNLANYVTSLAIVIGAHAFFGGEAMASMLAPVLFSPFVFIYGELFPKNLFFHAPSRMLRLSGPLFLLCTVAFMPLSLMIWAMNYVLQRALGASRQPVQMTLARKELQSVLEQGHDVGLLRPAQRSIAQGLFAVAGRPVSEFTTPTSRVVVADVGAPTADLLEMARQRGVAEIFVKTPAQGQLVGYVRAVELKLNDQPALLDFQDLIGIPDTETHLAALMRLQEADETVGCVIDRYGNTAGVVTTRQLISPMISNR